MKFGFGVKMQGHKKDQILSTRLTGRDDKWIQFGSEENKSLNIAGALSLLLEHRKEELEEFVSYAERLGLKITSITCFQEDEQ